MMDAHGNTTIIPTGSVWKDILERFTSRKFLLCIGVQAVASVALLGGSKLMSAETYLAFTTLILTSYSGASILDKKINGPS